MRAEADDEQQINDGILNLTDQIQQLSSQVEKMSPEEVEGKSR